MADRGYPALQKMVRPVPHGVTAVGIFLCFGAAMAALAGVTLARPGTLLDRAWALNLPAYRQLAPLGRGIGALFLTLSAGPGNGRDGVVQTASLGMETGRRDHRNPSARRSGESRPG